MAEIKTSPDTSRGLKTLLEDYERALILSALAAAGGHQRRAAKALGLLPSTLSEKMKRLGIRRQPTDNGGDAPLSEAHSGAALPFYPFQNE
jgi:DNA-binding NtrC family response regulator